MLTRLERFKSGQVIKGKQLCTDCKKEFNWVFQNGGRNLEVVEMYKLKDDEERLMIIDKKTLDAKCYCNNCGRMNFLKVNLD